MVQTVNGAVSENELGTTLAHEHICLVNQEMRVQFPDWFDEEKFLSYAIPRMRRLKSMGIDSVIDATPINLGRDIKLIRQVSEASGIHIIASTGLYFMDEPWCWTLNAECMAKLFIREICEGIQGTDIKAGIIKCASDVKGINAYNRAMLQAAAIASKKTNTPIITHTYSHDEAGELRNALHQQAVLLEAGVEPSKIIIGHLGDSNDIDYLVSVLKNGTYIGFDRFGVDQFNSTENRIKTLVKLIELGWAHRIVLSHDANYYADIWHPWDKPHYEENPKRNMFLISKQVLPELKRRGVSDREIKLMMNENIRAFFTH